MLKIIENEKGYVIGWYVTGSTVPRQYNKNRSAIEMYMNYLMLLSRHHDKLGILTFRHVYHQVINASPYISLVFGNGTFYNTIAYKHNWLRDDSLLAGTDKKTLDESIDIIHELKHIDTNLLGVPQQFLKYHDVDERK